MQSNNSSSDTSFKCFITLVSPVSELHEKLFVTCLGISCPLTVTSNCLLISALRKTNQLKSYSNQLITVMSSCDLILGLIFQSALVVMFFTKKHLMTCNSILAINAMVLFLTQTSALLLLLISIDRYLQVTKLNRYNSYMNQTRLKTCTGICIFVSALLVCIVILHRSFVTRALIDSVNFTLLWSMIILYSSILQKLQKHLNNRNDTRAVAGENANIASTQQSQTDPRFTSRSHLTVIKTLRVLQVTMLLLYTPFLVASMLWNYYLLHLKVAPSIKLNEALNWSQFFLECNAWVNAWILIHGNSGCRRLLLSMIRNSARRFWNSNSVAAETGDNRQGKLAESTF